MLPNASPDRRPRPRRLIAPAALAALALVACRSSEPVDEGPITHYVTEHGQELSGWMNVEFFHVPAGQRVSIADDFSVHASEFVSIEGDLVLADSAVEGPRADAPNLVLSSGNELLITGRIIGGAGRSFADVPDEACIGQRGGDGSSILLRAPRYLVLGALVAGAGGVGGPGANGGDGGSIEVIGRLATPEDFVHIDASRVKQLALSDAGFYGGNGGRAGASWNGRTGRPGRGGSAVHVKWSREER